MSAAAFHAPPVWTPTRRDDRSIVGVALVAALALHVTLLLVLPLPARPEAPPVPETGRPIVLKDHVLRPPDLPPPPEFRPIEGTRLVPVPIDVQLDSAPVVEPEAGDAIAIDDLGETTPLLGPVAPPPPARPAVWDEGDVRLVRPRMIGERIQPDYPPIARAAGRGGVVHLRAVVDESGAVVSIEVVSAPVPDLGFSDAAIEAVSQWRYEPGTVEERPVKVAMRVIVDFSLN